MKLFQYLFRNNIKVQNKELLWPMCINTSGHYTAVTMMIT